MEHAGRPAVTVKGGKQPGNVTNQLQLLSETAHMRYENGSHMSKQELVSCTVKRIYACPKMMSTQSCMRHNLTYLKTTVGSVTSATARTSESPSTICRGRLKGTRQAPFGLRRSASCTEIACSVRLAKEPYGELQIGLFDVVLRHVPIPT